MLTRVGLAGVSLVLVVTACSSSMSAVEYVESLNTMVDEGRSGILASLEAYHSIEEPTMADSAALLDEEVRLRRRFQDRFNDLDPPEPIADLHLSLRGVMTRILAAAEGLAGATHTAGSLEDLEGTPQLLEYEAANDDGNIVCLEV